MKGRGEKDCPECGQINSRGKTHICNNSKVINPSGLEDFAYFQQNERTGMEGREALEKLYKCTCIDAYKNRGMVDPSCWGCEFKDTIPDVIDILMTNGWLPPETIAKKYVRLDAEVHGEFVCGNKDGYCTHASTAPNCLTCDKSRPATVADLIGGK